MKLNWTKPVLDYGKITDPGEKKIVDDMNAAIGERFKLVMDSLEVSDMEDFIKILNAFRNRRWKRVGELCSDMDSEPQESIPDSLWSFLEGKGTLD